MLWKWIDEFIWVTLALRSRQWLHTPLVVTRYQAVISSSLIPFLWHISPLSSNNVLLGSCAVAVLASSASHLGCKSLLLYPGSRAPEVSVCFPWWSLMIYVKNPQRSNSPAYFISCSPVQYTHLTATNAFWEKPMSAWVMLVAWLWDVGATVMAWIDIYFAYSFMVSRGWNLMST